MSNPLPPLETRTLVLSGLSNEAHAITKRFFYKGMPETEWRRVFEQTLLSLAMREYQDRIAPWIKVAMDIKSMCMPSYLYHKDGTTTMLDDGMTPSMRAAYNDALHYIDVIRTDIFGEVPAN